MANLITSWNNIDFDVFSSVGADIAQAVAYSSNPNYPQATSDLAIGAVIPGRSYTVLVFLTKNTAFTDILNFNVATLLDYLFSTTLSEGLNVLNFTATEAGVSVNVWADPYSEMDFACTFYMEETAEAKTLPLLSLAGNLVTNRSITGNTLQIPLLQFDGTLATDRAIFATLSLPLLTINSQVSQKDRQMYATLSIPSFGIQGVLSSVDTYAHLAESTSAVVLSAFGGGYAELTIPIITILANGKVSILGRLNKYIPGIILTASGIQDILGQAELSIPAIQITAVGYSSILGSLAVNIPSIQLTAYGSTSFSARLSCIVKAISLSASAYWLGTNYANLTVPAVQLKASALATAIYAFALNTSSLGLTSYTNFNFNSLCVFNGKALGASSIGIHLLEGTEDNGENIPWRIETGALKMGFNRPTYCRIAGNLPEDTTVTVEELTGGIYEGIVESRSTEVDELRISFGKGLRSKYMKFALYGNSYQETVIDNISIYGYKSAKK